jgi:polar amino acid transport system substrate-binding protein
MQQLTQKLKNGSMTVLEVPVPALGPGLVLVKNHFSLVSAGTEGSTVKTARKGLIGKAKERPAQVKQVLDVLRQQGPIQTYRAVMKKLDAFSPLGYSCAGGVISIGPGAKGLVVGDLVACGGVGFANHAELVSVPENLCVKLHPDTDLKQAAYNTLGAIAMQGVRQADLRLGETCAVIGLGLIGQLTCLLLRAAGVRVAGIDIDPKMVAIAGRHCADLALPRETEGIECRINQFTGGIGCDAVIITAASDSLDPINFAGAIARKRGTIVVVGAVPTGFDRDPHFYKKELQVKMSCSYGPGRYDPAYEEKGIDYPPAYVRWTEKRNMEAFQELIGTKKIDVSYLTTHVFKLDDAPRAYDMMMAKSEPFVGILIEYETDKPIEKRKIALNPPTGNRQSATVSIGFIGAGSYAQSHLLPNIPKDQNVVLKGVMTATGTGSRSVGERFGFEFCTGDENDILGNPDINTVLIATRHDSHAGYVLRALKAGKNVFVEKPLCLNETQLNEIKDVYSILSPQSSVLPLLMVGYNRRFSPFARMIKERFGAGPMAMTYRINAGAIPADSWIQDPDLGGGRIIGEVCHFIDFLTFVNGSLPVSAHAAVLDAPGGLNDTLTVSLCFANGSIGTIGYLANGDKSMPKERVEIFANGAVAVIDDFKSLVIFSRGKKQEKRLLSQDKGQRAEVQCFIDAVRTSGAWPIPAEELFDTSRVTFKILESLGTGCRVTL